MIINKKIGFVLLVFCLVSCKTENYTADWLMGSWQRTNGNPQEHTYENWKKVGTNIYKGIGYTLVEKDTVFKENLILLKQNGQWIFEVEGVHEKPVLFPLEKITSKSFTAVNEANEFPKEINYKSKGENSFEAIISAKSDSVVFNFERIE